MKTNKLLSIAIIATLPFGAHATDPVTPVGPSAVPANGTAVVATALAPYVTITPGADDDKHIASTKYVIGAYNDAIAAVNKVNEAAIYGANLADSIYQSLDHYATSDELDSKGVLVYTTWEDDTDNGTTKVELSSI